MKIKLGFPEAGRTPRKVDVIRYGRSFFILFAGMSGVPHL
jgi:hypothetical protein